MHGSSFSFSSASGLKGRVMIEVAIQTLPSFTSLFISPKHMNESIVCVSARVCSSTPWLLLPFAWHSWIHINTGCISEVDSSKQSSSILYPLSVDVGLRVHLSGLQATDLPYWSYRSLFPASCQEITYCIDFWGQIFFYKWWTEVQLKASL